MPVRLPELDVCRRRSHRVARHRRGAAAGEIDAEQTRGLVAVIGATVEAFKVGDLDRRIAAIEQRHQEQITP